MTEKLKSAVILLSGGLDSATCLAIARAAGYDNHALSFRYGQRHAVELTAAEEIAGTSGAASHRIVNIDLGTFGGSALTSDIPVPKGRSWAAMDAEIPVTYVPARNTVFLSYALGLAEVLGASNIFIGVNALDYSGYPDCRPAFIAAFEKLANLATRAGAEGGTMRIQAPLLHMTKADIILEGARLGVDFSQTISCYDPDDKGRACGSCDSCLLRKRGFAEAGIPDPTLYK